MKKLLYTTFTIVLCALFSCETAPEPINYGSDACAFCKMTIVDQQHAAQYVTHKGKQFKFDAIECMLNDISEKGIDHTGILLVADYKNPGSMVSADQATYLISKEIKSPMGAYLSAFSSQSVAQQTLDQSGGKLYTWPEMLQKYQDE